MHWLRFPGTLVYFALLARAIPRLDNVPNCSEKLTSASDPLVTTASSTPAPASTSTKPGDCDKGGMCDCSTIKDKNGDEYFQCITNPFCEHCWHTLPTLSATSSVTSAQTTNFRRMSPGTYTVTTNGTVLDIVVTQQVVTPSTQTFVTQTRTIVITVAPEETAASSSQDGPDRALSSRNDCSEQCDCSSIGDEQSQEYLDCVAHVN